MREKNEPKIIGQIIKHGLFIFIGFIWIYPFLWMVATGFKTEEEMFAGGLNLLPKSFQFINFVQAWQEAKFGLYFANTLVVAIVGVLLVILLNATCGYAFGRSDFPGKKLCLAFIVATLFLPSGYTIIPIFELVRKLGLLNSLWGIILVQSGGANVIYVLLFMSFFAQIPKELEEAAIMDGCSYVRIFTHIMLPLSKPILATISVFHFITSWNDFLTPLVLTMGKPELRTLGVGMYSFVGEHATDWVGMAAASSISLVPIIILFLFVQQYFIEGVAGAVKG